MFPRWLPVVLVYGWLLASAEAADPRPNVVIFLVDDMGVMDTSVPFMTDASGQPQRYPLNDYYRTPHMERLAARGIRFNQFCAMSVCSPTRISLMTGQNAARHRTTNWINPDRDNAGPHGPPGWNWQGLGPTSLTLARILQTAGYRTIHVGKGHFGPRNSPGADPRNLGFDVNIAGASIGAPASYYGTQNYGNLPAGKGPRPGNAVHGLEAYHGTETFLTEALTREAQKQVSTAVAEQRPFLLYFPHYAVHAPFNSDPRFSDHYRDSGRPAPAQAFATLIEGMDRSLGELLDHLERLQVARNTLFFFLGDNGSDAPLGHEHAVACAAPLRGKKGSHYEGGTRVPFIAAWLESDPQSPAQQRLPIARGALQSQQAAVYDLFPTILGCLGIESPAGHVVDGRPLNSLLTGQRDRSRAEKFLMHYPHAPHRSNYFTTYRNGDWKVIYHYFPSEASENAPYQLFHLGRDPFEQTNLATREPAELRRLMGEMVAELDQQGAVFPVNPADAQPLRPQLP